MQKESPDYLGRVGIVQRSGKLAESWEADEAQDQELDKSAGHAAKRAIKKTTKNKTQTQNTRGHRCIFTKSQQGEIYGAIQLFSHVFLLCLQNDQWRRKSHSQRSLLKVHRK